MPALQNARHEAYAQLLAKGMHQGRAYKAAGFSTSHRSSASVLARKQHIRTRVAEILDMKSRAEAHAIAAVARKFELSRQWVIDKLVVNAEIALGERPINARAEQLEYRWDGAVAARSLELLGREVGLFTERKQIDVVADLKTLSDDDLLAQIRSTASELLELTANEVTPEENNSTSALEVGGSEENNSRDPSP